MKLRRESVENGDFLGPEGAFKKAPLSALAAAGFLKNAGYNTALNRGQPCATRL
jgi:hypothetical protein